jgi:hypothetical protein
MLTGADCLEDYSADININALKRFSSKESVRDRLPSPAKPILRLFFGENLTA